MLCYSVRRDNRDVPERNSVLLVNRIRSLSPGSASAVKGSTRRSRLGPLPPRRRFLSIISSGVVPRAGGVVTSRANGAGDMVSGQMSKKTPNVSPLERQRNRKNETKRTTFSALAYFLETISKISSSQALLMYRSDENIASNCPEVQRSDVEAFSSGRAFSFTSRTASRNSFSYTTSSLGSRDALSFEIILVTLPVTLQDC